jgi:predicted thioesterase
MLDLTKLKTGRTGRAKTVVREEHLANRVGSGRVDVYSSPMMFALIESACLDCVEDLLPAGTMSLGMHLDVSHIAPTPLGLAVEAVAELIAIDGRALAFKVDVRDSQELIGRGTHKRIVVDAKRFNAKLSAKEKPRA